MPQNNMARSQRVRAFSSQEKTDRGHMPLVTDARGILKRVGVATMIALGVCQTDDFPCPRISIAYAGPKYGAF